MGKGGWGWAGVNKFTLTNVAIGLSNSNSNDGPVVGVGVEWAFAPNWTAKVEYDNLFLNDRNFTVPAGFPVIGGRGFSTINRDVQTVTVGVNYLFNWQAEDGRAPYEGSCDSGFRLVVSPTFGHHSPYSIGPELNAKRQAGSTKRDRGNSETQSWTYRSA